MGGIIENASAILSLAQQRVEVSAQNIGNATTPGYKRRVSFVQMLSADRAVAGEIGGTTSATDFSAGKQLATDNPYDLAISGEGFFVVRAGERLLYTRNGQFQRDAEGRLVNPAGFVLQANGGDLVVKAADISIAEDGTVLQGTEPVDKLTIVTFDPVSALPAEGGAFLVPDAAVSPLKAPSVRQGALESANVSTGDEMVAIMEALRRAESAQRLVNVYDDLLGRAITTFGQS